MGRRSHSDEIVEAGRRLCRRLSEGRSAASLSASDVARHAGVSVDAVRRLEAGLVTNPGFLTVAAIAEALELPLEELGRAAKGDGPDTEWPRHTR